MKLITIFNFPDQENYNQLCRWWVKQALENSNLNIEIWHSGKTNHLEIKHDRIDFIQKKSINVSEFLNPNLVINKSQHNIGFKLFNLCNESDGFIFIDADAIILKNLSPLEEASKRKPFIAVDHQDIPGHTTHIPFRFLNSGVQACSDTNILNFEEIMKIQSSYNNFIVPGTDQAALWTYFKHINYDYTDPEIDWKWNNCAGFIKNTENIAINHYWYNYKPWNINCPLWNKFNSLK